MNKMMEDAVPALNIQRDDRRLEAIYSVAEAAHYLGLPASTARGWVGGVIRPERTEPMALSFLNIVELYVLGSIRRHYTIPLQRIRKALRYVEKKLGKPRPLIQQEFFTNGTELIVRELEGLVNVTREGQLEIHDLLTHTLRRIDRDGDGAVLSVSPWFWKPDEPRYLEIDPRRALGRLVVAGTAIPTEILAERFRAGESTSELSLDYNLKPDLIEMAIRWEGFGKAA
ncbi:MAG: DUF433 domain-containing protein [Deltaproteobacteria bacterium]|nr:DUF433 domain-containing protein [Deltaproteobacteria bacterium]